jgi:hypothetical protein
MVVLIVEVLYRTPGTDTAPVVLGWAPVSPFRPGPDFGSQVGGVPSGSAPPSGLVLRNGHLEVGSYRIVYLCSPRHPRRCLPVLATLPMLATSSTTPYTFVDRAK